MPSVKKDYIVKVSTKIQRRFIIGLILIAGVATVSLITSNKKEDVAIASPVRAVQPVDTIMPSVKLKNLASKKIEYRPSTDMKLYEGYCVHRYTDDTYVYQYIGETDRSNPKLRCS